MLRLLLFLFLSAALSPAGADPLHFLPEEARLQWQGTSPVILELRQGGRSLLERFLSGQSREIDLKGILKAGDFQLRVFPLGWRRGESFGRQGTGLGDLLDPRGLAIDAAGRIIVADTGNDRIQVFSPELAPRFEFGDFHWSERDVSRNSLTDGSRGRFNVPLDVAATLKDIFVADRENHRVQKFDLDGNFLLSFGGWGDSRGRFGDPSGLATDRLGNVYVADRRNDRVQKFDINGNFILEVGGFGSTPGRLNAPVDVAVDMDERIIVLDNGNGRIQFFDRFGHSEAEWPLPRDGRFDSLAVFGRSLVAVSEPARGRIHLRTGTGADLPPLEGLKNPRGLVFTAEGELIVVEAGRARLTRFLPENPLIVRNLRWEE